MKLRNRNQFILDIIRIHAPITIELLLILFVKTQDKNKYSIEKYILNKQTIIKPIMPVIINIIKL